MKQIIRENTPEWTTIPSRQNWLLSFDQIKQKVAILEQLAGPHIAWYTHKNPFSCWICDYIIICRRILEIAEEVLNSTEPPLDFMNIGSSHSVEESRDVA